MKRILQLSVIVILWNYGATEDFPYEECVKFENHDLRTPVDSIVQGLRTTEHSWYQHVDWMDTPAGDLTLAYVIEYYGNQGWTSWTDGTVNVFSKGEGEAHDLAHLVKRLLGLNHALGKIPGQLRVPARIFDGRKCTTIKFKNNFYGEYKHRIFLHVEDEDENKILHGQIIIPEAVIH